jgi:hypothetical protein
LAEKQNTFSLQYDKVRQYDICKLKILVQQDGLLLQIVHDEDKTEEICELFNVLFVKNKTKTIHRSNRRINVWPSSDNIMN